MSWLRIAPVPLLLLLAGCSEDDPAKPAGSAETPLPVTIAKVPCRYVVPQSVEGTDFYCGDLAVSENRANPAARSITLHVAVFKGKVGGTPTIVLEGGPGGSAESDVTNLAMKEPGAVGRFQQFLDQGDLVFFDQRGVGRSNPRLTCVPESRSTTDPDPAKTCFARHKATGVDFAGYDSVNSADDVADLARAIGAQKVNLYGISYGSRLGLEVLRRHPDIVRGAVIDAILPAQTKIFTDTMPNFDATVTKIIEACAADTKCNFVYPDLESELQTAKARLDKAPFVTADGSYTLDWNEMVATMFDTLYQPAAAGQLPYYITTISRRSQEEFFAEQSERATTFDKEQKAKVDALKATELGKEVYARLDGKDGPLHDEIAGDLAFGMYAAVSCADSGQFETLEAALAALDGVRPDFKAFGEREARSAFAACRTLPEIAKSSAATDPISARVPTIIFGGALDPITPSKYAAQAAETLLGSQLVIVPGGAHGLVDECGVGIKTKFLATLKPTDASCATGQVINFYYKPQ